MRTTKFLVKPCGTGQWGVFLHGDARALDSFSIKCDAVELAFELAQVGMNSTVEVQNEENLLERRGERATEMVGKSH